MKFVTKPSIHIENIPLKVLDEKVSWGGHIRSFLTTGKFRTSTVYFCGRRSYNSFVIDPEGQELLIGTKINEIKIGKYELHGLLPVNQTDNGIECLVDWYAISSESNK